MLTLYEVRIRAETYDGVIKGGADWKIASETPEKALEKGKLEYLRSCVGARITASSVSKYGYIDFVVTDDKK